MAESTSGSLACAAPVHSAAQTARSAAPTVATAVQGRPDDAADVPWPDDAVEVARVMGAWGLKGWIKVQPFAAEPHALFSSRRWFLKPAQPQTPARPLSPAAAAGAATPPLLRIIASKEQGDLVVAQARGIDDRAAAEGLRGARVFVPRASFPTAGADEFYWVDLIGLDVVNRQGEALGRVVGLLETGPHSVLRIAPPGLGEVSEAAERLLPFVAAFVDDVNLAERRITVDWGLDY